MNSRPEALRKQPVQARSRATFDAVAEATVQVLLRDGADGLTTTRVAERAGVSVGTLYQYFPNKRSLIEVVRARYFASLSETVGTALDRGRSLNAPERLALAIEALVETKRDNLDLSHALANAPHDGMEAEFSAEVIEHFARVLVALRSNERPGGSPSSDPAPNDRVTSIVAALEGLLAFAVKQKPDWLHQAWFIEELKSIAVRSLGDD